MQQELHRNELEQELEDIAAFAKPYAEDSAYTKQYFMIGRQAHVRSTQSFGTPALVWHVAFWPKRSMDPQNLNGSGAGATTREDARRSYEILRTKLAEDINEHVLRKLQKKGRIKGIQETFEKPTEPIDWETGGKRLETPVGALPTESISFTLWWSDDENRATCLDAPPEGDLRVRVQADIHPDFAAVTIIIDAGKPWNTEPFILDRSEPKYDKGDEGKDEDTIALASEDLASGRQLAGLRRRRIFRAARIVGHMASARLDRDKAGERDILPETDMSPEPAARLRWASKLLYLDIWDEFCKAFDCGLTEIAGHTDKVFANFRGVVLCAPGKEPETGKPKPHLSRFAYGGGSRRGSLDQSHPNGVVKAYWPFIRRTRSEADYRDWIACGIFDWRALYITALGGQSELDPNDEGKPDTDVPAGHLPQQKRHPKEVIEAIAARQARVDELAKGHGGDPAVGARIRRLQETLELPSTPRGDRPRPFHYLFLTSGEPDRRQVGRMVDRVNLLGTVRLYAMKNFSIIRDADVHLRIYGQLLDQIMSKATKDTNDALRKWWDGAYRDAIGALTELWRERGLASLPQAELTKLQRAHSECVNCLRAEETKLKNGRAVTELPLMLYRRLLVDIADAAPERTAFHAKAKNIFAKARRYLGEARKAKSRHDEDMAQLNRQTDLRLQEIKTHIDELGRDAIGGLPFRINRARFYADMYRAMVKTLRVGSIDTWWDYEQLASRGVDPPLKFIENVGDRLEKLRTRLRDAMDAVQTGAIANQTEATRDNTFRLEVIAREIEALVHRIQAIESRLGTARLVHTLLVIFGLLLGLGLLAYALLTGMCGVKFQLGPITIAPRPCG